jgi:hypothetical protein
MVYSIGILLFSTALFIFYIQTLCEKILRREFIRPYFQDVLNAIDLEFPRLREAILNNADIGYAQIKLAIKSDYFTLTYLMKKGNPKQSQFSWHERLLIGYFRILLLILPIRYAFHFHERNAVIKLTTILHHFTNLVGERVISASAPGMTVNPQA